MAEIRRDIKKKRNVWTSEEVFHFLELIKEKHILGLMDGKRLRVSDIFKTLIAPMKEAGFHRDVSQLTVKWKNLKAEYYKCKRHNGTSGNEPAGFEFFVALEDILGHRPLTQAEGYDSSQTVDVSMEELQTIEEDDPRVMVELYEDAPDFDGAIPGSSTTPGIQKVMGATPRSRKSSTSSTVSNKSMSISGQSKGKSADVLKVYSEIKTSLIAELEKQKADDDAFLNTFFLKQDEMMLNYTNILLKGMQEIFNTKVIEPPAEEESDKN